MFQSPNDAFQAPSIKCSTPQDFIEAILEVALARAVLVSNWKPTAVAQSETPDFICIG